MIFVYTIYYIYTTRLIIPSKIKIFDLRVSYIASIYSKYSCNDEKKKLLRLPVEHLIEESLKKNIVIIDLRG